MITSMCGGKAISIEGFELIYGVSLYNTPY